MKNRGLTFLEMLISLVIFSIAMIGYFRIFNVALDSQLRTSKEIIATNLARALMSEILTKAFIDPTDPSTALGPNTGESGRSTFDDVDDYEGLTESTPVTIGGQTMNGSGGTPDYTGFSRSVNVDYCEIIDVPVPNTLSCGPSKPASNYKKVTVSVSGSYVANISVNELSVNPNP